MGNINVNLVKSRQILNRLDNVTNNIKQSKNQASFVHLSMKSDEDFEKCAQALKKITEKLNSDAKNLHTLENSFKDILRIYSDTEKDISSVKTTASELSEAASNTIAPLSVYDAAKKFYNRFKKWMDRNDPATPYEIDSIVYDDEGSYGGDQGSPKNQWLITDPHKKEILYDTVRKYYPDMTDKEIQEYLKKLNSEGCGYVSIVNTIFVEYEGREEDFERDFGFPMYRNGDLNYDQLIVDFYAATDNHKRTWYGKDYIDNSEDYSSTEGYGTTNKSRNYRINKYLEDKGVDITFEQKIYDQNDITPGNLKSYAEEGQVLISFYNGYIYDEAGNPHLIDGGHSMAVTGVTEDGRFIVSSWGDKYYVDPDDIITFTNKDGKQVKTNYDFQVVEYKDRR